MTATLPLSIVIPTRNRPMVLRRTLESLAAQGAQPAQIVVVDASPDRATYDNCVARPIDGLIAPIEWFRADVAGAAAQRNQGIELCRHPTIGFFDDDILFEPECVARLWRALEADARLGGVNAMITNQSYHPPGRISRTMFRLMAGHAEKTYAGRVLGPAVNLLPEDREGLPDIVPTEWLNTTCTLYRRDALPRPVFAGHFTGYSLMEDLSLSLTVGRQWKLANARTARIFHDTQPGEHKSDRAALARMELVNRHYIMTHVMGRVRIGDYSRLALWELFQLTMCAIQERGGTKFWRTLAGKMQALRDMRTARAG